MTNTTSPSSFYNQGPTTPSYIESGASAPSSFYVLENVVAASQMPALTGDATSLAGSVATTVVALQGKSLSNTAPTTGEALVWNGSAWTPSGANSGYVLLRPLSISGPWFLTDSQGTAVNISSSTTCGLQEAINTAVLQGAPLLVYNSYDVVLYANPTGTLASGSAVITSVSSTAGIVVGQYATANGIPAFTTVTAINAGAGTVTLSNNATANSTTPIRFSANPVAIICTTAIVMPPVENFYMAMHGTVVAFSSAVSNACWTFDSCMASTFDFSNSIIVGSSNTQWAVINFYPHNPVPLDGLVGIVSSRFIITNPVQSTTYSGSTCISFNPNPGAVQNNYFYFGEINATGTCTYGLSINSPGASDLFVGNIFDIPLVHGALSAGIVIGTGTANAANMLGNQWRIGSILFDQGSPTGAVGLSTFGTYDNFDIGQIDGAGSGFAGINFQSTALKNNVRLGAVQNASTSIQYQSGSSGNIVIGNGAIALNGTAYTNP